MFSSPHQWLRLIANPDDDAAFLRAVQAPKREVGATTLARLVMGRLPISPWEGTPRRPWDDRLRIQGDTVSAPPSDVVRWCYGAW